MTIQVHQPRLEELIQHHMATGHFESVEDLLLQTLERLPSEQQEPPTKAARPNLDDFLMASPLPGSGLVLERQKQFGREIEL